jgi:hypothetical protein
MDTRPYELELELSATDSEGPTAKTSVNLSPRIVRVLIASKREGARVLLADQRGRTSFAFEALRGGLMLIGAPDGNISSGGRPVLLTTPTSGAELPHELRTREPKLEPRPAATAEPGRRPRSVG